MTWFPRLNRTKLWGICLGTALMFSGASTVVALPSAQAAAPTITAAPQQAEADSAGLADAIIATGKRYLGVPYEFGATTGRTRSFDCSSFTQYIFAQHGIDIARASKEQAKDGVFVPRSQLQPGDLVFFYSPIHHVGVYIGNGKVMHTFGKDGVTITELDTGWWDTHYTTARRVLPTTVPQPDQPQAPDDQAPVENETPDENPWNWNQPWNNPWDNLWR